MAIIKEFQADNLKVRVFVTRQEMGTEAARDMSIVLKDIIEKKGEANIIFASAPSQNEFFNSLVQIEGIEWEKVNAFHLDEYVGLAEDAPQGFGNFLRDKIINKVAFKSISFLNGNAENLKDELKRYTDLLKKNPADIVCIGIGENGHIAFNDPPVAFFDDPQIVKIVELEDRCKNQQVNDGCFSKIEEVPTHALTLTIPAIMSGKHLFCMVPGKTKADAVTNTIKGDIEKACPASILRTHERTIMYTDKDSGTDIL